MNYPFAKYWFNAIKFQLSVNFQYTQTIDALHYTTLFIIQCRVHWTVSARAKLWIDMIKLCGNYVKYAYEITWAL